MTHKLSHIDESGNTSMVDVSAKALTERLAKASALVHFPTEVFEQLSKDQFLSKKGSIIQTAVIAGIQAVKKTADLIPLCHQLAITKIDINVTPLENCLKIESLVKCTGQTGVEMEALTGCSVAALTIYDMCKALSHDIIISDIQLMEKTGGKSDFSRP